jgi:hypothetical protein
MPRLFVYWSAMALLVVTSSLAAQEAPQRLLLLAQGPDGHPKGTHEYVAGQNVLKKCLSSVPQLEPTIVRCDGDWPEGPQLLTKADGVVMFISEGAKWLNANPARRAAFAELAKRGGGLSVVHWGMGSRAAENIEPFVDLFGACHGGPDRKYKVLETQLLVAAKDHPIMAGLTDFRIHEEFYYQLKTRPSASLVPLLKAEIDGDQPMVAWAWERAGGGRSFGYSGCHFHEHWARPEYQRFLAQGVLWTLKLTPPRENFPAQIAAGDLRLE